MYFLIASARGHRSFLIADGHMYFLIASAREGHRSFLVADDNRGGRLGSLRGVPLLVGLI